MEHYIRESQSKHSVQAAPTQTGAGTIYLVKTPTLGVWDIYTPQNYIYVGDHMVREVRAGSLMLARILVYSSIYLALGAAIVAISTMFISNYPLVWYLPLIPFAGSFLIYNLNRLTDMDEDIINVYDRAQFSKRFGKVLLYLAGPLYAACLFLAYQRNIYTLAIALMPLLIALLYSIARLKKFLFLKNVLVAMAWGCSALLVAAYFTNLNIVLVCLYIFFSLQFLINVIIFDIKDARGDKYQGINSLPLKLGIAKTKEACLLIFIPLLIVWVLLLSSTIRAIILLPFLIYTATFVLAAGDKRPWWYYGVFVDGEFFTILLALLLWWAAWQI